MTHSSPPEQQFLEHFLTEHPEGSFPEFEAWAKEQREYVVDSGIEKRARTLLERHLQVRKLFPQGSSVDRPALSVFHRRPSASEDSQVMPGTEGLRNGQRIGHFRLTRFIARGGTLKQLILHKAGIFAEPQGTLKMTMNSNEAVEPKWKATSECK